MQATYPLSTRTNIQRQGHLHWVFMMVGVATVGVIYLFLTRISPEGFSAIMTNSSMVIASLALSIGFASLAFGGLVILILPVIGIVTALTAKRETRRSGFQTKIMRLDDTELASSKAAPSRTYLRPSKTELRVPLQRESQPRLGL